MSSEENGLGAIPSLGSTSSTVLGAPSTTKKAKSNVGKAFFLIAGIIFFLFLMFGTLWFVKQRAASKAEVSPMEKLAAKMPTTAQKNEELVNANIEKVKADLKAKEADEAAIKAAQLEAEAKAAEDARKVAAMNASKVDQNSQAANGPPPKPTPLERKMQGPVLVNYTGEENKPAAAPVTAAPATADMLGGSNKPPEGMAARLQPTVLESRYAGILPNLDYLLKRGTTIPCALKTGIDTTLAGFVICTAISDVYSANGKTLLVERGASIFGEQQSSLKQGQARVFILWTRIDNPSGVFANLDSPGTDAMGYNGVPGYVDTHFWTRFGGAIMLSLIKDFSANLSQRGSSSNNSGPTYNNSSAASQEMASEALRNSINIPPTLTVLPATIVNVLVARDVSFESVYSLVK